MKIRLASLLVLPVLGLIAGCLGPDDGRFATYQEPGPQPPVEVPDTARLAVLDRSAPSTQVAFLDDEGVEVARLVTRLERVGARSLSLHPDGLVVANQHRAWLVDWQGQSEAIYDSPNDWLWSVTSDPDGGLAAAEEFLLTSVTPDGEVVRHDDDTSCFMDLARIGDELLVADVWGPRVGRRSPEDDSVETLVSWEAAAYGWGAEVAYGADGAIWVAETADPPRLLVADPGSTAGRLLDFEGASGIEPWDFPALVAAGDGSVLVVVESGGGSGIYRAWRDGRVEPLVEDQPAIWVDAVAVPPVEPRLEPSPL